ncbi:eukaryotic translation initiation factor 3 subunit 6 [Cantharellus anzutake]|uniref:eukaryotic translation initiation factor 3 subunit 6 n=1 Tax=Cantharellus anzutake TaxID=1750568 RepID=UPI001906C03D|nr:eukaryotic translation initiation factor 3 subunit 6 [Cantharellus anzutake]KAF8339577.1 eukaryotic translation initiation factor 3 subunit 6 [Cantharellus anzutake]
MAQWDLTRKIIPYLDRHLVFPVLLNPSLSEIYKPEDVQLALYDLAKSTDLVDYTLDLYGKVFPGQPVPKEFTAKRAATLSSIERLQQEAQAVLHVIENPEVAQSLRQDKIRNLEYLKDTYGLTLEQISALYSFGQLQYSIGNYSLAGDYLYHFRILSTSAPLVLSSQWGKFASDLLVGNWDNALDELQGLREAVDAGGVTGPSGGALAQLQSRTWLLHWSLFLCFQHPEGRTLLLDLFLSSAYLNTIQTSCPWILRYLAAAAIISRKTAVTSSSRTVRGSLLQIVRIVQAEEYQYSDPITKFLQELYCEFDFDSAQKYLGEAEIVLGNDFFLADFKDEFMENARFIISETYIRIHQKIDIGDLSARLGLSQAEGEKWIVNLIRDTRVGTEAKIDLEKNVVTTNRSHPSVYQAVIEKTRGLARRTQDLSIDMNRRANAELTSGEGNNEKENKGKSV